MMLRLMLAMLVWGLVACAPVPDAEPGLSLSQVLGGNAAGAGQYLRATAPREFLFPADHGPHAGFRNEWWYLTGNLDTPDQRHFGYQLTFFNAALPVQNVSSASAWTSDTLWMAHFALTDVDAGQHQASERFSRGNPGLAGAALTPLRVWLDDWQFSLDPDTGLWRVHVKQGDLQLELAIEPLKPPVLQGNAGLSQKSGEAGNASYYYSMTRLRSEGTLHQGDQEFVVSGLSWLDREWSTSALGADQSGWNWFALQLADGQELMYYQLLDMAGNAHASSAGNWTDAGAGQHAIAPADIRLEVVRSWTSPAGVSYPVEWRLRYQQYDWRVQALVDAQWMNLSIPYWEGAVDIRDWSQDRLLGYGYLETVRDTAGALPAP